jgi:hypothetical protein
VQTAPGASVSGAHHTSRIATLAPSAAKFLQSPGIKDKKRGRTPFFPKTRYGAGCTDADPTPVEVVGALRHWRDLAPEVASLYQHSRNILFGNVPASDAERLTIALRNADGR